MGIWKRILVNSRVKALRDLSANAEPSALKEIMRALDDESVEVRRAAALSLEQFWWTGDISAIKKLNGAVKKRGEDVDVRVTAALALGEYIPKLEDLYSNHLAGYHPGETFYQPEGARLFPPGTSFEKKEKAVSAAVGRGKDTLLKALNDPDERVVLEAVGALANIQDSATTPAIAEALRDRDTQLLRAAIQKIDVLRETQARTEMKAALVKIVEIEEDESSQLAGGSA